MHKFLIVMVVVIGYLVIILGATKIAVEVTPHVEVPKYLQSVKSDE